MFNTYLEAYLLCSIRIMSLRSECNGDFGSTGMFWQNYLDMVQILLDFVKSIRLPD